MCFVSFSLVLGSFPLGQVLHMPSTPAERESHETQGLAVLSFSSALSSWPDLHLRQTAFTTLKYVVSGQGTHASRSLEGFLPPEQGSHLSPSSETVPGWFRQLSHPRSLSFCGALPAAGSSCQQTHKLKCRV